MVCLQDSCGSLEMVENVTVLRGSLEQVENKTGLCGSLVKVKNENSVIWKLGKR